MKTILVILMLAVASPCFSGTKTTRIYDGVGRLIGTVRETPYNIQTFDAKGHYTSDTMKNIDGSRTTRTPSGKILGHSTCTGECNVDQEREDGDE